MLRYKRLGIPLVIDISFEVLLLFIILIVVVIANFSSFFIIFKLFVGLKNYLWKKTEEFFLTIHYFLLQNVCYYIFMHFLHHIYYYYWQLVELRSAVYSAFKDPGDFWFPRRFLSFLIS